MTNIIEIERYAIFDGKQYLLNGYRWTDDPNKAKLFYAKGVAQKRCDEYTKGRVSQRLKSLGIRDNIRIIPVTIKWSEES